MYYFHLSFWHTFISKQKISSLIFLIFSIRKVTCVLFPCVMFLWQGRRKEARQTELITSSKTWSSEQMSHRGLLDRERYWRVSLMVRWCVRGICGRDGESVDVWGGKNVVRGWDGRWWVNIFGKDIRLESINKVLTWHSNLHFCLENIIFHSNVTVQGRGKVFSWFQRFQFVSWHFAP